MIDRSFDTNKTESVQYYPGQDICAHNYSGKGLYKLLCNCEPLLEAVGDDRIFRLLQVNSTFRSNILKKVEESVFGTGVGAIVNDEIDHMMPNPYHGESEIAHYVGDIVQQCPLPRVECREHAGQPAPEGESRGQDEELPSLEEMEQLCFDCLGFIP